MSEKFLKITKEGRSIQRLHGPKAREVYARDWQPYGWEIVGEAAAAPAFVAPAKKTKKKIEPVAESGAQGEPDAGEGEAL